MLDYVAVITAENNRYLSRAREPWVAIHGWVCIREANVDVRLMRPKLDPELKRVKREEQSDDERGGPEDNKGILDRAQEATRGEGKEAPPLLRTARR